MISTFFCQECVRAETTPDKLDHGIRYIFLFFLPFTMTIFPTLYIYILLIRHAHNPNHHHLIINIVIRANNDRLVSQLNIAKVSL